MKIEEIISEVFEYNGASIHDDMTLSEFPLWDSMTHMFLIMKIEEVYSIELENDDIVEMQSVHTIKEILKKYKINF